MRNVGMMGIGICQGTKSGYVLRSGTATSAYDVDQSVCHERSHLPGHHLRCLVIFTQAVGQTGIGMNGYIGISLLGQHTQWGEHILSTEGAVESHRERMGMSHTHQKSLQGLSAEYSSGLVADGGTQHQGHLYARLLLGLKKCPYTGFDIQ